MRSSFRISPGWIGGKVFEVFGMTHSVIVDDLDPLRIAVPPDETDTVLVVNSNAVLSSPSTPQRF